MTNVSTSRFRCRTLRRMARPDRVDWLVAQWRDERPDLDVDVMAEVARLLLVGRRSRAVSTASPPPMASTAARATSSSRCAAQAHHTGCRRQT